MEREREREREVATVALAERWMRRKILAIGALDGCYPIPGLRVWGLAIPCWSSGEFRANVNHIGQ